MPSFSLLYSQSKTSMTMSPPLPILIVNYATAKQGLLTIQMMVHTWYYSKYIQLIRSLSQSMLHYAFDFDVESQCICILFLQKKLQSISFRLANPISLYKIPCYITSHKVNLPEAIVCNAKETQETRIILASYVDIDFLYVPYCSIQIQPSCIS